MEATRDAFGRYLPELAEKLPSILALTADLAGATRLTQFKEQFPERFFDFGIAENNMIGAASGLAEHGFLPFCTSFASFLTGKYDTIRVSLVYSRVKVCLVGTHAGLAIGKDGATQMGLEDIGLMSSLPRVKIWNPSTPENTKRCMEAISIHSSKCVHYLRLGRQPVDYFSCSNPTVPEIVAGRDNPETLVISSGCVLGIPFEALKYKPQEKKHKKAIAKTGVVDLNFVSPSETLDTFIKNAKNVITIEDHSTHNGVGSMVANMIAEGGYKTKLYKIGWPGNFYASSGEPRDLYKQAKLTPEHLRKLICSL